MIRTRLVDAIDQLRRYTPPDQWTNEEIADAILTAIPEVAALDGLKCRDCGANQSELDQIIGDGLCDLCRDTGEHQAVPV